MHLPPLVRLFACAILLAVLEPGCARSSPPVPPATDGEREALIQEVSVHRIASTLFAPVYPALARQVVEDYGITQGVAVDVGGSAGYLAIALARITDLTVYVLDIDPSAVALGALLARDAGLARRVRPVQGDAQDMPFRDDFADLVVSRGSIFFWADPRQGLREVYRILKPGGVAWVGGGFSRVLAREDPATYASLVDWRDNTGEALQLRSGWKPLPPDLEGWARAEGLGEVRLERGPGPGMWVEIRKPGSPPCP
ncbi:MAG: class I SAM-dependent methyltransferase [Deltaproteobacteria bacterium]|nr:class I SAM-dependent methyltransferase [Deltaproteobacteria bacterium]